MKTADIKAALRVAFAQPHYATFFEVKDGAGYNTKRSADAVIMSLWPSRGLTLKGIEIKVSRGDWQRELKNPAKAESIARYCDEWIVVTGPGVIRSVDEVPETWGWMECSEGGNFTTQKKPQPMPAAPIDRAFLAALLRRADEMDAGILAKMVSDKTEAVIKDLRDNHARDIERSVQERTRAFERLTATVNVFEAESGITIAERGSWGMGEFAAGEIGRGVKILRQSGTTATYSGLSSLASDLRKHAEKIEGALADIGIPAPVTATA